MAKNWRDYRFAEAGGMVSIHPVAIHHSKHPQALYSGKLPLYYVTVLVDLRHLRNEARSGINTYLIHDVINIVLSVRG